MKKLLFITLLLLATAGNAQVRLSISPHFVSLYGSLSTMTQDSFDSIQVRVINNSAVPYNGTFRLHVGVRDSANASLIDTLPVNTQTTGASLLPGDSIPATYGTIYNISSGGYRYGIDVIVVWPVAISGTAVDMTDSAEFSIFLQPVTGINELDLQQALKLYPNPVDERFTIWGDNITVESVLIYDTSGKALINEREKSCINVQALAPGIYFAEVVLSNKKHYLLKFIKQKSSAG